MKMAVRLGIGLACVLALSLVWLTGCENDSEGTTALVVDPPFADLSGTNTTGAASTQTFTVTEGTGPLSLPLQWRVRDPYLGRISGAGGYSATYARTGGAGDNAIIVRDQYGAEGVASIRQ